MCASNSRHRVSTSGVTEYMRALTIQSVTRREALSLSVDVADPAFGIGVDRLFDRRLQRRRHVLGEHLLPDIGRALRGIAGAGIGPILEIRPVREQRAVERRLVTGERMRSAKEMTACHDSLDGIDRE